jgi:glutamate/tyrosine decarboxylase-like PLP-dependent enzyme
VRAEGLQGGHPTLLVYGSTETHGWLKKGCELLGLGAAAFRRVPVLDDFTVNVAEMEAMIVADRAAGHRPICIVGTAGTVQTGATDDLEALADLAARQQLWFHVDGAFGSMAALSPDTAAQVKGQERADSIAFDLHKWGYLPFDVACVLVRHDADLVETFSAQGAYLSSEKRGVMAQSGVFFADRGVELTRSFKALKVWMRLRAIGTDTLGQHIARNVAQAHRLAALVQAHPELELLAPAPLNIVNLRYTAPGLDDTALDALNREILISLQEDGVAVPSGTVIRSRFAIRVAIANHRSNDADFDALVEAVVQRGRSLTVVR